MNQNEATGGVIMTLLLLVFLWYVLKHKKAKPTHVFAGFAAGVLLSGSLFGLMTRQITSSLGAAMATMFSTVTSTSGGGGQSSGGSPPSGGGEYGLPGERLR